MWEASASAVSLEILDQLIALTQEIQPDVSPRYTKHYVGLEIGGRSRNFLHFRLQKSNILARFKISRDPELDTWIDVEGLNLASYEVRSGLYQVRVRKQNLDEGRDALIKLITRDRDAMLG